MPVDAVAARAGRALVILDLVEDDLATRRLVAAAVCAEQVIDLIDRGVNQLHFYTMNRADLVYAICHLIGMRPRAERLETPAVAARRSW